MLKSNPDSIFNQVGEWVDVDFETILDKKLGYRGSDIPLLPEKKLSDYSTFHEILTESKKYSARGFNGKITPLGLLIMTRMLYKYRNSNAQWFRVATVLELIYKYLGGSLKRNQYFKNNDVKAVITHHNTYLSGIPARIAVYKKAKCLIDQDFKLFQLTKKNLKPQLHVKDYKKNFDKFNSKFKKKCYRIS